MLHTVSSVPVGLYHHDSGLVRLKAASSVKVIVSTTSSILSLYFHAMH